VTVEPQVALAPGAFAPGGLAPGAFAMTENQSGLSLSTCDTENAEVAGSVALVTIDRLHWLSAGLTSFARGMNDAPKLAGLVIAATLLSGSTTLSGLSAFVIIAVAMTFGGYMAGLRVTKMLAEKVTVMNHHEGFTANLVTSMLVSSGAIFGLPMSTTHVSASALIGIGASGESGNLHMGTVKTMLAAWVITLPGAAIFGMLLFWMGRLVQG